MIANSLGDLFDIIGGGTPSKRNDGFYGGNIPWATVRDMNVDILETTEHSITTEGLAASSAKIVPKGEVIIASRVGLGKFCILGQDTAINQDLRGLIPKASTKVDRRYLFYWLQSIAETIVSAGRGATVQGVTLPFLKALPFPYLALEEQQRIVAILDEAFEGLDRARANAEANLQSARALFSRCREQLFNDAADHVSSRIKTVEELAASHKGAIRTGPFGSQLLHSEFVEQGIAVLGIDNAVSNEFKWGKARYISAEKYQTLKRYTVFPGDVVITIMGTCGRCAVIPDDIPLAINTKHLCCITLDKSKCLPAYLHGYFLHSAKARDYLRSQASGSVMDGLNMGIIKEMPVEIPSPDLQNEVIDKLIELNAAEGHLVQNIELTANDITELRAAILKKAFSGELP